MEDLNPAQQMVRLLAKEMEDANPCTCDKVDGEIIPCYGHKLECLVTEATRMELARVGCV